MVVLKWFIKKKKNKWMNPREWKGHIFWLC
jgi:hypothetical protein